MRKAIVAMTLFLPPAVCPAATLRPDVSIDRGTVLLSDLFDDAGPQAGRVLGPSPPPGERLVVEAPQLAAIARQFGADWRPQSSADRVVIDRPGEPLPRQIVIDALRAALSGVGAPADAVIDLPGYAPPMIARDAKARASVSQLDYQAGTERFTAEVTVLGDGNAPMRMRVSGTVEAMEEIVVPARHVPPGVVLTDEDLRGVRLRAAQARGDVVRDRSQAVGLTPRHGLAPGQPIPLADLGPPLLVLKGARVTLLLAGGGLSVVATGEALEPGGLGEHIQVMNPSSRAVVLATVVSADTLRVDPDQPPVRTASR